MADHEMTQGLSPQGTVELSDLAAGPRAAAVFGAEGPGLPAHLLARARAHRGTLKLAEGEAVGPVGLYQLDPGRRDAELNRLAD